MFGSDTKVNVSVRPHPYPTSPIIGTGPGPMAVSGRAPANVFGTGGSRTHCYRHLQMIESSFRLIQSASVPLIQ
jgi:hypothetical protein